MNFGSLATLASRFSNVLTIGVLLGIAALLGLGYRATREWQQSVAARITRQNDESAELILGLLTRDMRGAQTRILGSRDWDDPPPIESSPDATGRVAAAFARYAYPESFFTWRGERQPVLFFSRAERIPTWKGVQDAAPTSPVIVDFDPAIAELVRRQISACLDQQLRYAIFNIDFAGVPYQVVARIVYADTLRERLDYVSGFVVNLDWVRRSYFADILSEVSPQASGGLIQDIALLDGNNQTIFGSDQIRIPMAQRSFPLLFVDPFDNRPDLPPGATDHPWTIRVSSSRDPILAWANRRADATLLASALAVVFCGVGLIAAHGAALRGAKLAEMRSRFVSSVTHELKTPLANIHALAATLERQPQPSTNRYRTYPGLVLQEANNLSRLVDNLLAYARITDVSEVYSFEPIAPAELIDEALRNFEPRLLGDEIHVRTESAHDIPFVRADQRAMVLALSNLIENAIRHLRQNGELAFAIRFTHSTVLIEVADNGSGISSSKLAALRDSIASRTFSPADGGGMGLAIAAKVIADHRGTLTIDSDPDAGTRCIVSLPTC